MRADSIRIESDEDGFHLVIETAGDGPTGHEGDRWDFNIQACAPELFEQVKRQIGEWLAEGEAVRVGYQRGVEARKRFDEHYSEPYDQDDPKHENWHSIHADIWDMRGDK